MLDDKIDDLFNILTSPQASHSDRYHAIRSCSQAELREATRQAWQLQDANWSQAAIIINEIDKYLE
jgi:ElaB/YqjD/DUF883 family membrane-anchored ribosome-binding protein